MPACRTTRAAGTRHEPFRHPRHKIRRNGRAGRAGSRGTVRRSERLDTVPRSRNPRRHPKGSPDRSPAAVSRSPRRGGRGPAREAAPRVWQPKAPTRSDNLSFEDMMSRFKSQSEEKMADLDHETNNRRGGGYAPRSRRGR